MNYVTDKDVETFIKNIVKEHDRYEGRLSYTTGRKYIKIIQDGGSAFGFIDIDNGDVFHYLHFLAERMVKSLGY